MKKLKVIVCGSTFGQLYLKALRSSPEKFQLIGILGTGSDRTLRCAEEYNIKVYKSIDEVPDDIDLACVAVRTAAFGGNGTEIALQLLELIDNKELKKECLLQHAKQVKSANARHYLIACSKNINRD